MSLPTPYWTDLIEISANIRLALDCDQDVSVLDKDGTVLAVLVHPDRYRRLNAGQEYQ